MVWSINIGILVVSHGTLVDHPLHFHRYMVEAAQAEYERTQQRKTPRWILRFALDSLSLDPPPTSVVADCLEIIAIDLGCDVSNITTLDERYICSNFMGSTF
jgi:hypothetical protein